MLLATANGVEHGLINTKPNSCKDDDFASMTPENREKCRKQRKEDCKKVKVKYINYNGPGNYLELPYCKYAGDPIHQWKFLHGHCYEIPKGLLDQVNEHQGEIDRGEKSIDGDIRSNSGKSTPNTVTYRKVHEFIPTSF